MSPPQDLDHIGAAMAAQAAHEAELQALRFELITAHGEAQKLLEELEVEKLRNDIRVKLMEEANRIHDRFTDFRSLERLYARAIDAQVQAERARDDARAECQKLLEENRALRANRGIKHEM